MKLSIVIPAYNEENRILKTLNQYYDFFKKKLKNDFEIIVVPNNCKDNTCNVVEEFLKDKKNIKIKIIPNYCGKGGAVMEGFELASGDYIGFTDADNSIDPENFNKLLENIGEYDSIISSRKIKGAIVNPKRKWIQNISSLIFNKTVNLLFKMNYKDTQCGAKLFKKKVAKFMAKNITEKGWAFDVDLLYIAKKNNFRILEYPINWTDSIGSKLTSLEGLKSILKLIKYKIKN